MGSATMRGAPLVGSTYIIEHQRKGTFIAKVLEIGEDFIRIEIVKGHADYMSMSNNLMGKGQIGAQISVRTSFCSFQPYIGGPSCGS